jgi:cytochrome c biogenesis protein CcdA
MGLVLLIPMLNDWLSVQLSRMISHAPNLNVEGSGLGSQFIVGASLGLVWLPCVGPTLGTAIALASTGQSLGMAFIVMLSFGLGTALPLILLGYFAQKSLQQLLQKGALAKKVMGVSLLFLSFIILTGIDRQLEILALSIMPSWAIEL